MIIIVATTVPIIIILTIRHLLESGDQEKRLIPQISHYSDYVVSALPSSLSWEEDIFNNIPTVAMHIIRDVPP